MHCLLVQMPKREADADADSDSDSGGSSDQNRAGRELRTGAMVRKKGVGGEGRDGSSCGRITPDESC